MREMPFKQRLEKGEGMIFPSISGKGFSGRGNSMGKGPEAGICLFMK